MKKTNLSNNERGIAHFGLILVTLAVMVGAGYLVYMRFDSKQTTSNSSSKADLSAQEEIGQEIEDGATAVDQAASDAPESDESGEEVL